MATRKSSRRTKHPIKLKDFVADDFVAESTTPQQMSVAVKRELSQVESLIKDLTTTIFKAEPPTVNDRATKDLRTAIYSLNLTLLAPNSTTARVHATECAQDGLGDRNNNTCW